MIVSSGYWLEVTKVRYTGFYAGFYTGFYAGFNIYGVFFYLKLIGDNKKLRKFAQSGFIDKMVIFPFFHFHVHNITCTFHYVLCSLWPDFNTTKNA